MVDVNEAAHAVGNQNLVGCGRGNPVQPAQQRFSPRSTLVGAQPKEASAATSRDSRAEPNPLRFDWKTAHSSAALNASSVGGISTRARHAQ